MQQHDSARPCSSLLISHSNYTCLHCHTTHNVCVCMCIFSPPSSHGIHRHSHEFQPPSSSLPGKNQKDRLASKDTPARFFQPIFHRFKQTRGTSFPLSATDSRVFVVLRSPEQIRNYHCLSLAPPRPQSKEPMKDRDSTQQREEAKATRKQLYNSPHPNSPPRHRKECTVNAAETKNGTEHEGRGEYKGDDRIARQPVPQLTMVSHT